LLQNEGKQKDELVNERALLLQTHGGDFWKNYFSGSEEKSLSFLQQDAQSQSLRGSLATAAQGSTAGATAGSTASQAQTALQTQLQRKALEVLRKEGGRLGSLALSALAVRSASDPFTKVKDLIQKLVERLIDESTQEATKKGFCDESLAKAETDRTFRWEEVLKLNGELAQLEAKKKELAFEIEDLGYALTELNGALGEATRLRDQEKTENLQTIKDANEGLKAVSEALIILKTFYKDALKAEAFIQSKLSPVEDDNPGAGFDGAYTGSQTSSNGILGLLEVIQSDFERTLRKTTESEKEAAAAFVKYDRATKADISGKSQKKELDEEDLKTTITTIASKMEEMGDNMDLVDKANSEILTLKPMCIDTGMSYSERVQKREDEIAALKKALCILDPEQQESACKTR